MTAANDNKISVFLLGSQWKYDAFGIATVNKSLANSLFLTDPDKICVTSAVQEEQSKISQTDINDASKHNVRLVGVNLPRGKKSVTSFSEIDCGPITFYHHFLYGQKLDFVVGHAPYLANAAFNIQDFYKQAKQAAPKIVLVVHSLPKTDLNDLDEDLMYDWLKDADFILSVGSALFHEVQNLILCLEDQQKPKHSCYFPCPVRFLTEPRLPPTSPNGNIPNIQNVLLLVREPIDLGVSLEDQFGIDVKLACTVATRVSAHFRIQGFKVKFVIAGALAEAKSKWEETFKVIKQNDSTTDKRVEMVYTVASNTEEVIKVFRKCHLCLFPLKSQSPLFGTEALIAAYAGVPILVSENSGIASLLEKAGLVESIVTGMTGNFENDVSKWTERVIPKLYRPWDSHDLAEELRKKLLVDCHIAASQLQFVRHITENSSAVVRVQLDEDATVLQRGIELANQFSIYRPEDFVHLLDAQHFVAAFLLNLLHHREKIEQNQLDHILPKEVKEAWTKLLEILEERNRTLTNVQHGSVLFTLFCPNPEGLQQLQSEDWIRSMKLCLTQLLNAIGVTSTRIIVFSPRDMNITAEATTASPRKDSQKPSVLSSSGHGSFGPSLTPGSIDILETSTLPPMQRLDSWLDSLAPQDGSDSLNWPTSSLKIVADLALNIPLVHKIAVSETGHIAILSDTANVMVTKSGNVKHFGQDTRPSDLNFLTRNGREFLVAVYGNEGNITLWDLEQGKSQVVFQTTEKTSKVFSVIDEKTVALCEQRPNSQGNFIVYILNTEGSQWKLRNKLYVEVWCKDIYDMCYFKGLDNVSSLIMCSLADKCVFSVDLIGGRIRWQKSLVDMGPAFQPMSVCADDRDHVFVASLKQNCVQILSGDDGEEIRRIPTLPQKLVSPTAVYFYEHYLHVAHRDENNENWKISKIIFEN